MPQAVEIGVDSINAHPDIGFVWHFQTLLDGIVANPQQPIAELPLLTANDQQQLLGELQQ